VIFPHIYDIEHLYSLHVITYTSDMFNGYPVTSKLS